MHGLDARKSDEACGASLPFESHACAGERRSRGQHIVDDDDAFECARPRRTKPSRHIGLSIASPQQTLVCGRCLFYEPHAGQLSRAAENACEQGGVIESPAFDGGFRRGHERDGLGPGCPGRLCDACHHKPYRFGEASLAFVLERFDDAAGGKVVFETAHARLDAWFMHAGRGVACIALDSAPWRSATGACLVEVDEMQLRGAAFAQKRTGGVADGAASGPKRFAGGLREKRGHGAPFVESCRHRRRALRLESGRFRSGRRRMPCADADRERGRRRQIR